MHVVQPGLRARAIIVATTLLDAEEITKCVLGQLYRACWEAELARMMYRVYER